VVGLDCLDNTPLLDLKPYFASTDSVPEAIKASLQLSEAALVGLGLPTGPVIASGKLTKL